MSQDQNNRIYDKLDRLDEKFDRKFERTDKRLDGMERELIIYNEHLKQHIEGVKQLKEENMMLREYIDIETKKLEKTLEPVTKHVEKVQNLWSTAKWSAQWFAYIVTLLGTIGGIVYTVLQILGKR